jgi:hypothetical protein
VEVTESGNIMVRAHCTLNPSHPLPNFIQVHYESKFQPRTTRILSFSEVSRSYESTIMADNDSPQGSSTSVMVRRKC